MSRVAMPVQTGDVIDFVNTTGAKIMAGDVVPLKTICGIAETDIEDGRAGAVSLIGVWDVPAATGAVEAGDALYWDAAAKKAAKTAEGNVPLGVSVMSKGASAARVRVKIG